jgi:hypothetical protein
MWIKDLNIRPENLKIVKERPGKTLKLIGIGNDFPNKTQMSQHIRKNIEKWDYIKLKSLCTTK